MTLKKLILITSLILLLASACGSGAATEAEEPSGGAASASETEAVSSGETAEQPAGGTGEEPSGEPGSGPGDESSQNGVVIQAEQLGSFFAINEVGLGPDGFVALTNFTGVPVSMAGVYLCQGSDCFALPDEVVGAGETVRVAAGEGEGLENVIATEATFGELRPADGELALFVSDDIEDTEALLLYLQWGSTPHELTSLAVERGLWFETSYAPSGPNATRLYRVEESGLWLWE